MPVQGRNAERALAAVLGNFTLEEAAALCSETGIDTLIAHQSGLFAFNTADPAEIDRVAARPAESGWRPGLLRPDTRHAFLPGREASAAWR